MSGFRALSPNINVNTASGPLRTELQNTFARLDGTLQLAPYRIATQVGPVGNTGSAETDLVSSSVTIGTLAKQNSSILIFACGNTAANANNKTLKVVFGTTTLATFGPVALNNGSWTIQGELVRNGAAAEAYWLQYFDNSGTQAVSVGTATESLASNKTLKITGTGTASSDATVLYWKLLLLT